MISNCNECINRNDCEYMQNWKNFAYKAVEFFKDIDKDPETHSYFSYSIRCDYFYPDEKLLERYAQAENNYKRSMMR